MPQAPSPSDLHRLYRERGWWGDMTLDHVFKRNVEQFPDRLAVADAPNREDFTTGAPMRLTYRALDAAIDAAAAGMVRRGVRRGDVIVFQLPNVVDLVILALAGARIGAVISPLLPQFDEHELKHIVHTLKPKLFFTISRFKKRDLSAAAKRVCADRCDVITLDGGAWFQPGADDAAVLAAARPDASPRADDILTVCWTSGTEGRPKGAMRTHNNWRWSGRIMVESAQLRSGDVILNTRPLVNMAAIGGSLAPWIEIAGTLVMHPPLDPALALQQIRDEGVNATFMPPAFFISLLNDTASVRREDIKTLRVMGTGSAAIPGWVIARMEQELGVDIVNFFGANEGTSLLSSAREMPNPAHRAVYFPRLGRPEHQWPSLSIAEQIESRLIDLDTGEEITAPGKPGELRMRSPSIFAGYFAEPQMTQAAFDEDGYLRTGDLFEIAGDGELARYYRFVGRCKDIIVRGGLKIAPAELDEILSQHPQLKEAAVFAYPDQRLGEKVAVAAVAREGSVTLEDIIAFMKERHVATYKLPERLYLTDHLPRNGMHKVVRRELADHVAKTSQ